MSKVSIGLPVCNAERYLEQTLDSLLSQTFQNLEIIICDNASSDSTEAICRRYSADDSRIRYFRNLTNIGGIRNHNRCFQLSSGTYFKWNGYDDICLPTYLEKCVAILDYDPSIVLCQAWTRHIDENGADLVYDPQLDMFRDQDSLIRIERTDPNYAQADNALTRFQDALSGTCVCQHALGVARSEVIRKTGLLGLYANSDRAFLIEMALYGKFAEVPEELFLKREHPRNTRNMGQRSKSNWAAPDNLFRQVMSLKAQEHMQILGAVLRSPLSIIDKLRCIRHGVLKAYVGRLRSAGSVSIRGGLPGERSSHRVADVRRQRT